jgi:hypothetical protein
LFVRVEVSRRDPTYVIIGATIVVVLLSWYGWLAQALAG